jgi:hypothetical protein
MIGHASVDENGKAVGGKSGDSTKKEVCTRSWYNSGTGWHTVLRPKTADLAEKSAVACEAACANNLIGYDQGQRNTLNTQAKMVDYDLAKITKACECDCSALMHVCAIAGGANLTYGSNAVTTRNMVGVFMATGNYEKLTDEKYLKSDKYLKRGDILVKNGHTAMNLTDGDGDGTELPINGVWDTATTIRLQQIFGTTVDGKVSNQWMYYMDENPGLTSGWQWHTKPNGKGSQLIKAMQKWAGMSIFRRDGEIGPATIKALQAKLGTKVDGYVSNPSQMVKALQRWANDQ